MRVYHFINQKFGLKDIRERRLKVATIDELNDPFELLSVASKDREIRQAYASTKAGLAQFTGMICFSGSWHSPVQWSHYADRHRGLCLGFDVSAELVPITYTSRRLNPDIEAMQKSGPEAQTHMLQMLATKFSHWRYENEYRLFIQLDEKDPSGFYFYPFSERVTLREVIVGFNSTITRQQLIRALRGLAKGIEVRRARLAFQSFRVVPQRRKDLW